MSEKVDIYADAKGENANVMLNQQIGKSGKTSNSNEESLWKKNIVHGVGKLRKCKSETKNTGQQDLPHSMEIFGNIVGKGWKIQLPSIPQSVVWEYSIINLEIFLK